MKGKIKKKTFINSLALTVMLASVVSTSKVSAASEVVRMPGTNRFVTASNVAYQTFGKCNNVILVNGLGYADAVSAAPLAKILNAPILLTDAAKRPSLDLLETLGKLGAKKVYIIGGQGVVTKELEGELKKSYAVERIAGEVKDGRYGTNAEVAKRVLRNTGAKEGILVSAEGYADALSIASIAATKGEPVLFANRSEIPHVVKNTSKGLKISAVGGQGVLPDKVLTTVGAERIAKGKDRFDTNIKVLDFFKKDLSFNNMFIAAGGDDSKYKFADALVASAAAAKYGAPVILNGLGTNKESKENANNYIMQNMNKDSKVTIIGGIGSIDISIEAILKKKSLNINEGIDIKSEENKSESNVSKQDKVEVNQDKQLDKFTKADGISTMGLNQIKVEFDKEVEKEQAENTMAYTLDDKPIQKGEAIAKLQDDKKTVIITFVNPMKEGVLKLFKIEDGFIKEKNIGRPVVEKKKKIAFIDNKTPSIESVQALDGNKIKIIFSEAIDYNEIKNVNNFKLDGETLLNEKANVVSVIEPIDVKNTKGKQMKVVNEIIINLDEKLDKGQHTLIFPISDEHKVKDTSDFELGKDQYIFNVK